MGVQEAATGRAVTDSGGLRRGLTPRQMTMIGLGGAIGTGLFLGSTAAISHAGPAILVCYVIGAVIALVVAWSLVEMTVVHPTRGSFGAIAQSYLGGWAGFMTRWTYWLAQVVAIGGEVIAAGIYMQYWWSDLPVWVSAVVFSAAVLTINTLTVRWFGETEFWFASIKVTAIIVFIVLGAIYVIFGLPDADATGLSNFTADDGFVPNGVRGMWGAMIFVIFSFYGVEVISVTAAEARDPERSLPRAIRAMVGRLTLFYVVAIAIVVAVVPWKEVAAGGEITASPFVRVFDDAGIPTAAGIMNFVVLTAALSSMNANLYLTTRMAHSLAHDRLAPRFLGAVTASGVPVASLSISAVGLAIAAYISNRSATDAYLWMLGISIFGGLVVWMLILATLVAFRRRREAAGLPPSPIRLPGVPYTPVLGVLALLGILLSAFDVDLDVAWKAGVAYLVLASLAYWAIRRWAPPPREPSLLELEKAGVPSG